MRIAALTLLLCVSACCSSLKSSIADHSTSIHRLTQATLAALPQCKQGQAEACDLVEQNVNAIEQSAKQLQDVSK